MNFISKIISNRYLKNESELKKMNDLELKELIEKTSGMNVNLTILLHFFICIPILSFLIVQLDLYNKYPINEFTMICSFIVVVSYFVAYLVVNSAKTYIQSSLKIEMQTRNWKYEY